MWGGPCLNLQIKPCLERDSPGTGLWLRVQGCQRYPAGSQTGISCAGPSWERRSSWFLWSHPTAFPGEQEPSVFMESSHCPSREKRSSRFLRSHPPHTGLFPSTLPGEVSTTQPTHGNVIKDLSERQTRLKVKTIYGSCRMDTVVMFQCLKRPIRKV